MGLSNIQTIVTKVATPLFKNSKYRSASLIKTVISY